MIYGAGSIGNHLAYACRSLGWNVMVCDIDNNALVRMKNDIYPSRYGKWDDEIHLVSLNEMPEDSCDVIIIGTPPDTHIDIALNVLRNNPPRVLLIEKPLCPISLEGGQELLDLTRNTGTITLVGYNHILTKNTKIAAEFIRSERMGIPLTISVLWLEHWGGIFNAHPWLDGPHDSYLGFYERGGGAGSEHSHGLNLWQYFSRLFSMGRVVEVSAMLDIVDDGLVKYDRICQLNLKTEKGLVGSVVQDVISAEHVVKTLRVQGTKGYLEWYANLETGDDAVFFSDNSGLEKRLIRRTRPDDFIGEIEHIRDILEGSVSKSSIALERGLETMLVMAAAHLSHKTKKNVLINYNAGYTLEALN